MTVKSVSLRNPYHLLALGFGSGLLPKAPGTWGTLLALALYWPLQLLPPLPYAILVIFFFVIGIRICAVAGRDLGVTDHPAIVWDELVGFWIAAWTLPLNPWLLGLAFVVFRLLDIFKPWPIGMLERRVGGGLGVMLDDAVAGVFTFLIVQGAWRLWL